MRRTLIFAAAAAAALSLAACNKHANNTTATGNEAVAVAGGNTSEAGAAVGNMNPNQVGAVNKAENAVGAAIGATSAATLGSHDTGAFVDSLVRGNTFEIQAAKIAEQKAQSPDVKAFARMMLHDHTAMGEEAKPIIAQSGKTPPSGLDPRLQGLLDNLNAASAPDFDKTYIDQQVAGHKETLTLVNGYAQNGSDAGLKGLAAKAAPTVQRHLDRAESIQTKLAARGGGAAGGNTAG